MFKQLARRILRSELIKLKSEIEEAKENKEYAEKSLDAYKDSYHKIVAKRDEAKDHIASLTCENNDLKNKIKELEKENAILRQYYKLNEEPSQETKDKMYLDLKYIEMDKEINRLSAVLSGIETQKQIVTTAVLDYWNTLSLLHRYNPYSPISTSGFLLR